MIGDAAAEIWWAACDSAGTASTTSCAAGWGCATRLTPPPGEGGSLTLEVSGVALAIGPASFLRECVYPIPAPGRQAA